MLRIRWSYPEEIGQPSPAAWHDVALIAATLFLNFAFWMVAGTELIKFPLPQAIAIASAASLFIGALFFAGPALALQSAGQPLNEVLHTSLGTLPAWGVRVAAAWFLLGWIPTVLYIPAGWYLSFILRRPASTIESGAVACGLLVFVVLTGLQGLRTSAKLAAFTNKLAVAILVAALIRVRAGIPAAFRGSPWGASFGLWDAAQELSSLAFYAAPLTFLAARPAWRMLGGTQVLKAAGMGIAVPLFGTLLLTVVIADATYPAGYGQPSLEPSVAMALWNKAAQSALPPRMILVGFTVFGVLRFFVDALAEVAIVPALGRRLQWLPLGALLAAAAWAGTSGRFGLGRSGLEVSATCLSAVAAVLTVDYLAGKRRVQSARRVDWIGLSALFAGLCTHFLMQRQIEPWWHPSPLPAYAVAFVVTACARRLQQRYRRRFLTASDQM